MIVLAFDTATADTVVGLLAPGVPVSTARHVPVAGERPGHATQLLGLARGLLDAAGLGWDAVTRIGVGTGPGTFTGLRIGVATARGLVQAGGQELVGLSTLEALALGALAKGDDGADRDAARPDATDRAPAVLACLDARRGEAYVAAWRRAAPLFDGPRAVAADDLAAVLSAVPGRWSAVGDGSVRFRSQLEGAGAHVPPDDSALHHVDGARLCELAARASPTARDALEPEYVRAPDAVPKHLR